MEIFIDIGNTNASFWKDGKAYSVSTQDFAKNNCLDFLKTHNPTKVFVASVVPKVSDSLENERNVKLTKEQYFDVIYNKTASLFEASAQLGAIFSQNGSVEECGEFGKNIGFAFQIMDDILDYTGSKTLNKDSGTDFKERKITLPILLLLKKDFPEKSHLKQYFSAKSDNFTFKQVTTLLQNHNIFQECNATMEIFTKPAEDFAKNAIKSERLSGILLDLLKFFTNREI